MQAGGHRFDPDQLHQIFFPASRLLSNLRSDVNLEAGWSAARRLWQVSTASGPGLLETEKALMFDNEIDWVTHLVCWLIRREAHEQRKIPDVF